MDIETPILTHLDNDARDQITATLQRTLVELIDLSLKGKQLHWVVLGPRFRAVHLELDDMLAVHREFADTVAERCVALGRTPNGQASTVAASSTLNDIPAGYLNDEDAVQMYGGIIAAVTGALRERLPLVAQADPVTHDLLVDILGTLEMHSWRLQALASKVPTAFSSTLDARAAHVAPLVTSDQAAE